MSTAIAGRWQTPVKRFRFFKAFELIALLGAARDCSDAVRERRRPAPTVLRRLSIDERAFDRLGF
jgi:hypothetical protein